jgi:hypothetical protein
MPPAARRFEIFPASSTLIKKKGIPRDDGAFRLVSR